MKKGWLRDLIRSAPPEPPPMMAAYAVAVPPAAALPLAGTRSAPHAQPPRAWRNLTPSDRPLVMINHQWLRSWYNHFACYGWRLEHSTPVMHWPEGIFLMARVAV